MPRILPWMMDRESTITPSKRRVAPLKLPQKRAKLSEIESDSANESVQALSATHRKQDCVGGTSPSSPAPERPMESFMHEGMDNDDQYRMVEDEFLATAQRFTVHLHAAEYKRQEKMVRARNAETISSISRPVTQKMPDHTKRKVEGITRTKIQQEAIQTLFGSKTGLADEQEDSSDDEELAYFNTTLRGLMDSPRRKAESLSKLQCDVTTRAAAGFQRPASQHRQDLNQTQESPQPKSSIRLGRSSNPVQESLERLSDLDDDLDAPVPASRFAAVKKRPLPSVISHSSSPSQVDEQDSSDVRKPTTAQRPPYSESPRQSINGTSTLHATQASSNNDASTVRRRLFKSRRDESKVEKGTDDQDLDLIPTFL